MKEVTGFRKTINHTRKAEKFPLLKYNSDFTRIVFMCSRCKECEQFTNGYCDFCGGCGEDYYLGTAILLGACYHFKGE